MNQTGQKVVAKLVERAESAEIQVSQLKSEMKALQQAASSRAAAGGAANSAVMSAAQVQPQFHCLA